jgi:hypothetical protein
VKRGIKTGRERAEDEEGAADDPLFDPLGKS